MGDFEKSETFSKLGLDFYKTSRDESNIAKTLNTLAINSIRSGSPEKALVFFKESIVHKRVIGDSVGIALVYGNMANVLNRINLTKEAIQVYLKAIHLQSILGVSCGELRSTINLAGTYTKNRQYEKSKLMLIRAELLMDNSCDVVKYKRYLYDSYYVLYYELGNYKKSLAYYELKIGIVDSIQKLRQLEQVRDLEKNTMLKKKKPK